MLRTVLKFLYIRRGAFYMHLCSCGQCPGRIWNPPLRFCFGPWVKTSHFLLSFIYYLLFYIVMPKPPNGCSQRWRSAQNFSAAVGAHSICARAACAGTAGGYGIRPYVFVLAFGPKLHIFYYLLSIIFYLSKPFVSSSPSIKFMHCTAAPELPLPRLSNRLISCICVPSGLARQ